MEGARKAHAGSALSRRPADPPRGRASRHCGPGRLISHCAGRNRQGGMRVRGAWAVAAVLVLASQAVPAATLDRVKQTGVFKIGYRADAKPYSYSDDKGQPAGYIVDLCREVATAVSANAATAIRTEYVLVPADQR